MIYGRPLAIVGISLVLALLASLLFAPILLSLTDGDEANPYKIQEIGSAYDLFLIDTPINYENSFYMLGFSSRIEYTEYIRQYQGLTSNTPITLAKKDEQLNTIWETEIVTGLGQWYSNQSLIYNPSYRIVAIDETSVVVTNDWVSNDNLAINQTYDQDDYYQIISEFQILSQESGDLMKTIFVTHSFSKFNLTQQYGTVRYFNGIIYRDSLFVPYLSTTRFDLIANNTLSTNIETSYGYVSYDLKTEQTRVMSLETKLARFDGLSILRIDEIKMFEDANNANLLVYRIDRGGILSELANEIVTYSIDISTPLFSNELIDVFAVDCWTDALCNQEILSQDTHLLWNVTNFEGNFLTLQFDQYEVGEVGTTKSVDRLIESRKFSIETVYFNPSSAPFFFLFLGLYIIDPKVIMLTVRQLGSSDIDNDQKNETIFSNGIAYQISGSENATVMDFDFYDIDEEKDYQEINNRLVFAGKTADDSYLFISTTDFIYTSTDSITPPNVFMREYRINIYRITIDTNPDKTSALDKIWAYGFPFAIILTPAIVIAQRQIAAIKRSQQESRADIYPSHKIL